MGKDSVKFRCHSCGHCCTEVVALPTPWDVVRIIRETKANPYEFLEFLRPDEISEVEEHDPTWLDVDGERFIMALKRGKKGCFFLDKKTGFCSIYTARPQLCRLYPFRLQENKRGEFKGFTLHKDVGCPRHRDGEVATQPLYEIYLDDAEHQADYADLARVFNRRKHAGMKPEDFIEMFVIYRKVKR